MNIEITNLFQNFLNIIIPSAITLIASLIVLYINKLRRSIEEKNGQEALKIFDMIIHNVVKSINQNFVGKIKENNKLKSCGVAKLKKEQIKFLKNKAKQQINFIISEKTKNDLKAVVNDMDKYIDNMIESKVKEQKDKEDSSGLWIRK